MNNQHKIQSEVEKQQKLLATDPIRTSYTNRMLEIIQRQPRYERGAKNVCITLVEGLSKELKDYLTKKYPLLYYVPTN